jgi:superfamily I DNA and/or RNA helicase
LNYLKADGDWAYLLISISDTQLSDYLEKEFIQKDIQPLIVIAESDPPLQYLYNLKEFVESNQDDAIVNSDITINPENWKPIGLDNENDITNTLLDIIETKNTTIIQGPPGTGKSYYAAKIIQKYLINNQAIAVCALTNKALMEVLGQPALKESLKSGLIYKTSLSKDESKLEPLLKLTDGFTPKQGELLATTFYRLSDYYNNFSIDSKRFELLIIEEASQAFLATIAMFHKIANKVVIVGDHKQLPPVVQTNDKILGKIHPYIKSTINGLETFALNNNEISYRLTKTMRLTDEAATLTGHFYDNQLKSISPLNNKIKHPEFIENIFHLNGAVSIVKMDKAGKESISEDILLNKLIEIAKNLLYADENIKVSILVPTKNYEKLLTYKFSRVSTDFKRITISTVHKIQGLTSDYTFFYMPLTNLFSELNDNFFNVASSRAKRGCLIVTYNHLDLNVGISKELNLFLEGCKDVTESFTKVFKK